MVEAANEDLLSLRRADGTVHGGAKGGGEIAGVEPAALVRQVGGRIDVDLAADPLPQPAKGVVLGQVPAGRRSKRGVRDTETHRALRVGALRPNRVGAQLPPGG